MAKKKLNNDDDNNAAKNAIQNLLEHLQKSSGGMACLAKDIGERSWGIPSDHISYRWLTDNVCFPMGRVIGIAGMKESCKSAYAATIVKKFLDIHGTAVYIDTEKKISDDLYNAVVGRDYGDKSIYLPVHSTESWQEQVLGALESLSENPNSANMPMAIVVDSLGGVDTQESNDRIEKEGGVNPRNTGGMIKCKSHNEFFRYVNKHLYMKPYSFIYINHLSDDPNSPIQGSKRKPGGTGQDYHAVMDFWFSIVKGTPQEKVSRGFTEKILKVSVAKNSIGTSKRHIEIPYRWNHLPSGELGDVWFDWDAATAMLLAEDGPGSLKTKLKHILTVTCNANKYSCKELGLVAVTDTEVGEAIRNNVEMREMISDSLGINRMKVFEELDVDKNIYEKHQYPIAKNSETKVDEES